MTDTPSDDSAAEGFEQWHRDYRERGAVIEEALGRTVFESLEAGDLSGSRRYLRDRRASFEHKFCLLLYASGTDAELAAEIRGGMREPISDDELQSAIETASHQSTSTALTILMMLLHHQAGMHLVMLERQNEDLPEGPTRLRVPDNFWFEAFTQVAELAQAVIVIGNLGPNLIREVQYLKDAGLAGRMLMYVNAKLFRYEENKPFEELHRWHVRDGLKEAVACAASQPAE